MAGDGTAALADQGGHGNAIRFAAFAHRRHHIVGVVLQGVVGRGGGCCAAAVVVDPQAAADIEKAHRGTESCQFHVDLTGLLQGVLEDGDVIDLAADMEVQQAQIPKQVVLAQALHRGQEIGDGETEFGFVADGASPAPGAAAGQLGAYSDVGSSSQVAAGLNDPVDFVGLLDHHNRLAPQPSRQDRGLDVKTVLVAVADQQRVRVIQQRQGNQQLRLAACLQPEVPAAAATHQFFHDVALLVALHRENALISPGVVVLRNGAFECGMQAFQPVLEDVVEANQQRQPEIAALQFRHQLHQVQTAAALPLGLHADVSATVDREVRSTPAIQPVQRSTVFNRPAFAVCHLRLQWGMAGI